MLNIQEVFTKVVTHLRTQGEPARELKSSHCMYRLGELSCAVGCLIPDDQYDPSIEGESAESIMHTLSGIVDVSDDNVCMLLSELQTAHDMSAGTSVIWMELVNERLQLIADKYQLTLPEE